MITIGKITEDELEALARLYIQLWPEPTDSDRMRISFRRIDSDPDYTLLGARDGEGRLVGALLTVVCEDLIGSCRPFMVLENMIVNEEFRGRGVGLKLMDAAEEIARHRGCGYILLVSSDYRTAAHGLYHAKGYRDAVKGFRKVLL